MKIENLVQGTPEWRAYRAAHFNASDAPCMMGCSPYKTRSQLLHVMHTGVAPDVDAATQRRFDAGHRFEALARPLAEQIIGDSLYPITGSNGKLSASFDGLTLEGSIALEHKTLNDELRAVFADIETIAPEHREASAGKALPLYYRVQMEQQVAVSGCERVLFMASKWADDGTLLESHHCWYMPDPKLRGEILAAWTQFEMDLAAYVPPAVVKPVAAVPQERLPAPSVQLSGSLAVVSNLEPFGVALRAFVARIPKQPSTDEEFATTEVACKRLKDVEERLAAAEDTALASMTDVEAMRRIVADLRELARTTRLASEKLVKQRKEQIREAEVARGVKALQAHRAALNERLGEPLMPVLESNFGGVIKGLKTLDSVRDAIDTELARCKIAANEVADRIAVNMRALVAVGDAASFPDAATLVLKAPDDLSAIIAQRVAETQRRIVAERERIRAEEQAKAEAAARTAAAPPPAPTVAVARPAVATQRQAANEPPTLTLGTICDRLGFTVSAAFLADTLGLPPAATDKAAKLYRESDWPRICAALVLHIQGIAQVKEAA
jgi:putative phage-type endonuclease